MEYKQQAFKYCQHSQKYLSLILPVYILKQISRVLIYGEDNYGYQRKPNEKHYNSIKKNILENKVILPTSIILSVDSDYIDRNITTLSSNGNVEFVELRINTDEKFFRIVDGQHRLRGLEEAAKKNEDIENFMINVIILITEPSTRVLEVKVFSDINSLAKKIKTDLTTLAEYNYELLGEKTIGDIGKHVCVKAAYFLNEKTIDSVWHNAIIFNINLEKPLGIIGLEPFRMAIEPIAKMFLNNVPYLSPEDCISYTDIKARELSIFINDAWDCIRNKWKNCFHKTKIVEIDDITFQYYDEDNYLQKTTGTYALSSILFDCIKEEGFTKEALNNFNSKIIASKITSDDWQIGGIFSGLTSKSGFQKAKKYILNEN
jgi:DGQHR domain-containing protein